MQEKNQARGKKKKKSFVIKLRNFSVIVLLGYAVVVFISQQVTISEKKSQVEKSQQQLIAVQQENEEYLRLLSLTDEKAYMEKIAIEKLGYAYPGERRIFDKAKN